jgi:hypothetical protein
MTAAALVETIGGWIEHHILRTAAEGATPIIGVAGCQGSGKSTWRWDWPNGSAARPCRWTTSI